MLKRIEEDGVEWAGALGVGGALGWGLEPWIGVLWFAMYVFVSAVISQWFGGGNAEEE